MKRLFYTYPLLGFITLLLVTGCQDQTDPNQHVDSDKLFAYEIFPLLQTKCFACHGDDPEKIKGKFDLRSLDGMHKGGESGKPALIPGNADNSPVFIAASWDDPDFQMPPKENDRLTAKQLELLKMWIDAGAPWPNDSTRKELLAADDWDYGGLIKVATRGGLSETWTRRRYKEEDLWAFQPIADVETPANAHPVDGFILPKLKEARLKPAPKADRQTLIRRATFDLTGLPPTPQEIEAFLADDSPEAFEKVINRLLDSPHYGEQWARHWLDVVRYADTDGFANDYSRPNAWRYRDYVIRSFNQDKPYDQFIREQIAGDEIDPEDPEMLVAVGFLRMGPWEHTSMSIVAETRQFFLDDVTNGVGETFLSLPLRCARCHDHKFDPIPTQDYYRMQAVFATTQFAERVAPFLPAENLNRFEQEKAHIKRWLEITNAESDSIREKEENAAKAWYREHGKRYLPKRERMKLHESQRPPRYLGLTFQDLGYRKVLSKRRQTLNREKGRYEPLAFSVYSGPNKMVHSARPMRIPETLDGDQPATFVLTGGSVYAPADEVEPGTLSAVATLENREYEDFPQQMDMRRLSLARWLTQENHPLVLRSIVNRVWQYHFGQGIAGNPNNFGATGKKPTHPELLDWLARRFAQDGWSIKSLHRLIVTSDAYQRASSHPDLSDIRTKDPDNQLLAVFTPRRLEAEELRDASLFISGELNPELGGIPVRPEINMEVALQPRQIMGSVARAYQPSRTPAERNRRTIYAERYRGLPNPMLEVFNQPGPDLSCEQRTPSTVTPQVFTLFNGRYTRARALALAIRLEKEAEDLEGQIRKGIELAWNRPANDKEVEKSLNYVSGMVRYHQDNPPVEEAYPTEVVRTMFEEMTGESFEFTEQLDVFKDYVPDTRPWDVSPETRALADFCLVLINANEFVYVY